MARNEGNLFNINNQMDANEQLDQFSRDRKMKTASLVLTLPLFFLFTDISNSASVDQREGDHHHEHEHDDFPDTRHQHRHKHLHAKPFENKRGKLRVMRKKKKPESKANNAERFWQGVYDTEDDATNVIDIDSLDLEIEGKDYPYESQEITEYHSHPHEHPHHGHDTSSVYHKYDDLRPLDLTKLIPMVSLLGLYVLSPTYLQARKKRDNSHISDDIIGLDDEGRKLECFMRLACRVGELSKEVGVPSNPLVEELMENEKFSETVKKYNKENKCNTFGCADILTF